MGMAFSCVFGGGGTGVAQLVARSTPDRCVVDSSPTHGTEHFGFPPSAPRLGNQRPWYVQPRLAATGHIKDPVPLIEKRRGLQRRSQVSLAGGADRIPGGGDKPQYLCL